MSSKKVTITEVAKYAGVSVTTVSMVLGNKGRISPDTIDKVNQAVEELGYIRNRAAANLRSNSSEIIGLILKDISDPYYSEVASGISEEIERQGYMLILAQSGDSQERFEKCMMTMSRQGVGGIAFCPIADNQQFNIKKMKEQNLPLVCVSRASLDKQIDFVGPDNNYAAKLATEHLIKQGHRRIAYVGGASSSLCRAERIGGYCSTLMQFGLPFKPEWVVECEKGQKAAANAVQTLLSEHPQITAILCHHSSTALGAVYGIHRSGRQIGKDQFIGEQVSLIGFDDVEEAELTEPPLTFVNFNAREMGRQAAKRLISQLEQEYSQPYSLIQPPQLIIRESA
ncbi:Mal regulon transcriptional regulator MalI [Vibrio mediterranei]|uniref:Mal regulon transcriptional regulator MalI n=1 Tax=Vibrio mediterranei TaxID=689 RepID=UPI001EFEB70E|nr:Mal regulon transcriptional regulator MalI [Vibrio mediterranei]MCG9659706.1 Mal regulon transcriptional regulator MalI [Vibrio mediterranei]MCG9662754.1 Mal regulon transcriptional regulator MalI [Vibrio mediterranei]